jgi:hypothetical protein
MLFARRNSRRDVQMLSRELDWQLLQPLFRKYSAHPPQIVHYTTADALDAILSSGNLRMTHSRFLNDSTEMLHGRRIINGILEAEASTRDKTAGFFDYSRFLFNEVGDDAIQCFVTSFSVLTDAADLWARYGAECAGVAISFDTRRFGAKKTEPAPYYVGRVTYSAEEQRVLLEPLVAATKLVVARYVDHYGYDVRDVAVQILAAKLCSHLNHHSISLKSFHPWHVEREWRTVFTVLANDSDERKELIRLRDDGRPFVDIPVLSVDPDETRMPISAITIGSAADESKIRTALHRYGYDHVEIRQSQVVEDDLPQWP